VTLHYLEIVTKVVCNWQSFLDGRLVTLNTLRRPPLSNVLDDLMFLKNVRAVWSESWL